MESPVADRLVARHPVSERRLQLWLRQRYRARHNREGFISRFASGSVALFGMLAMSVQTAGMPTGLGALADQLIFLSAYAAAAAAACGALTIVFSLLFLPLPRRLAAIWSCVAVQGYIILKFAEFDLWTSVLFAVMYACAGAAAGGLLGLLLSSGLGGATKTGMAVAAACATAVLFDMVLWKAPMEWPDRPPAEAAADVTHLSVPDPSDSGPYPYSMFSYGSGKDKHRAVFGGGTDYIAAPADASAYITSWPRLKTLFWGFNQKELPINGRVWMPEGEGPFPLVLIVHGNHLMEYFSDGGYGYLGELLASRGMIAVSVDANFLNYSVWSGIPNDDMKMRAWLLLKHLQRIQTMDESGDTPFAAAVDWSNVALVGHSRGGQAAAMAADAERWFAGDEELVLPEGLHIRSVVAIAPVDKAVDSDSAELEDVNYLTLQGAMDADVNNFYGDRQYNRVGFSEGSERFKASLYIENANHSQFNTAWGRMDERLPGGLFLNRKGLLEPEEQRQIAKVYISAFLETTLHGREEYKALFQDYRSGADWLPPSTRYISRYEGADFIELVRFDRHDPPVRTSSSEEIIVAAKEAARDRDGNRKGTTGMVLEWEEEGAVFEIQLPPLPEEQMEQLEGGSLVFSVSNLEWDLIASADEHVEPEAEEAAPDLEQPGEEAVPDGDGEAGEQLPPLPVIEVVLADSSGGEMTLLLDEIAPIEPPAYTSFLSIGLLERRVKDNKYKRPVEPVFQTVVLPIELFEDSSGEAGAGDEPVVELAEISSIGFRFLSGPGKIMIDDIGFLPKGGSYVEYRTS